MTKVLVVGGGIGGMTAAQELLERGFEVSVYDYRSIPGGKSRTIPAPNSGTNGRPDLPGEHGFRFVPAFYRHLPDSMTRIPFPGNKNGVYDNL
ncbi:MAG TPA: NAD(P)-binding protein, partial [Myxococcales bacterium]|nr:NAD(P)-binding protein [Myxococcales bacterium]